MSPSCGPAPVHTAFPANACGQDHGQARWVSQQGDAVGCAGKGQSWRRPHRAPCASSSTRIMWWDISSIVTPLGFSADFQEWGVTAEPALLGHRQQGWSSHPRAGAHILGYFSFRNLRLKRTPSSHPLTFPAVHVTLWPTQCLSVKHDLLQPCKLWGRAQNPSETYSNQLSTQGEHPLLATTLSSHS